MIAKSIKLTDSFFLSYLWVLGGYELIRTISQRCQERREILGEELNQRIHKLKGDFERLRIPLAKMEPAWKHTATDSPIAFPAFHKDLGISWRVSEDLYIPRRQLSDSLLSLFEDVSAKLASN